MPYIFPRRRLRTTDVLDNVEMDLDFQPAAEKYSGKLNAHDFNGALMKASVGVASRAYYRIGQVGRSVSPGYSHGISPPTPAGGGSDAAFTLINDLAWHTVDDMELAITTGVSSLWIIGWLQYSRHTWPFSTVVNTEFQANVQFAISVDGHIIEASISGKRESYERNWVAAKPNPQWTRGTTAFPGPGIVQLGDTPSGMGPHFCAVRLGCAYAVQPGQHTIRLLARRCPRAGMISVFSATDYIVVYSRRLFVLESGQFPGASSSPSTVDVPALQPETLASNATLQANRAFPVRNAYNAVGVGAVARGGFRNEHLPSAVFDSNIANFGPAVAQTTNDIYPGYGAAVFAGARAGATGWWELDNGAGGTLRVTRSGGGAWDRSNGTLLILGNVHVSAIVSDAALPNGRFDHFGVITLGYNTAAGNSVFGRTEAGNNSVNLLEGYAAADATDWQIEADVPVFFAHEPTDGMLPAGAINYFTLFGSTLDGAAPALGRVTMTWRSGSLIVIQLRD